VADVPNPLDVKRVIAVSFSPDSRWYQSDAGFWRSIFDTMHDATILPVVIRSIGIVKNVDELMSVYEDEIWGSVRRFKPPLSFIVWDGNENISAETKFNGRARREIISFIVLQ
jgi:hypothetical protein